MILTINNNNGFSLEGLKIYNVYDNHRYAVIVEKNNYDNFKQLAKAFGFSVVNFDLVSSTPYQYAVKIALPDSWGIKITM